MTLLRIKDVEAVDGFRLKLRLTNGMLVQRDVEHLLTGAVFAQIRRDATDFAKVFVDEGALTWPNGADLCPDVVIWGGAPPELGSSHIAPPERLVVSRPAEQSLFPVASAQSP